MTKAANVRALCKRLLNQATELMTKPKAIRSNDGDSRSKTMCIVYLAAIAISPTLDYPMDWIQGAFCLALLAFRLSWATKPDEPVDDDWEKLKIAEDVLIMETQTSHVDSATTLKFGDNNATLNGESISCSENRQRHGAAKDYTTG